MRDNPALTRAADDGPVLPLFVLDPALWKPAGPSRRAYLVASLRALSDDVPLSVRHGDPVREVVDAAREVGAEQVHVAADFGPYGRGRDDAVEAALAEHGIALVRTGSPYAVGPGRVVKKDGEPYQVFTPFARAWREHGWRAPAPTPERPRWRHLKQVHDLPDVDLPDDLSLPEAGEAAAHRRWQEFLDVVDRYATDRDRPDVAGTSQLSVHLRFGEIHPRTLLADLARRRGDGPRSYATELAWRDFYADVLHRRPETAREYLRPEFARMPYADPSDHADAASEVDAWREGRTGYPIVDAGMRQLRATGWMHNRVRMIAASFLVKDLHVEWQVGARHFMHWLVDGDLASNQHGWQWVAGCGTDAAPYFRVFNPTAQGRRFDPDGSYVRRWVTELAELPDGADPHAPAPEHRRTVGYPAPIVDHAEERREALARYEVVKRG